MDSKIKQLRTFRPGTLLALGLAAVLLLAAFGLAHAGILAPPQAVDLEPDAGGHSAPVDTSVSVTYDQDMEPGSVSPQAFAVHARQTGWLTKKFTVKGGTITLDPLSPFHAGELVQVSATTALRSKNGEAPLAPTVWQFTTAPWRGTAQFRVHQVLPVYNGEVPALGDLDGDGDLDAVTTSWGGSNYVLHNDGTGTFCVAQTLDFSGAVFLGVDLGDLDGDADLDAVLTNYENPGWNRILINDGTGHFTDNGQPIPSYGDTYDKLGDLDGDGDLDLFAVAGAFWPGSLRVWKNDGTGHFTLASDFDSAYGHVGVALGDLDGDGDLDAFTTGWSNTCNKVWLNNGSGAFSEAQVIPHASTFSALLGDLDGDDDLDAYLANSPYPAQDQHDEVWLNDGTGHFTDSRQRLHTVPSLIPALGDLDADGDLDVYLAGSYGKAKPDEVWLNDGTSTFSLGYFLDDNRQGAWATLGDLDGDGDLDVMSGSNPEFVVLLNGD